MENSYLSSTWNKTSHQRLKKIFNYHYLPTLPHTSIKKTFFLTLSLIFSFIFLATISYLSLVSIILNLRYYATQIILRNQPFILSHTVLKPIAFNPNIEGRTKYPHFGLVIPKIGVDAPIIPNVDPDNYSQYMRILKKGVALAKGSSYPNQDGVSYIFAHSTNLNPYWISYYNAVFYLLNKLKTGDKIYVWYQNKQYPYQVSRVFVTSKKDKSFLLTSKHLLVLQTCYPPGTSLKRLIVIATPIETSVGGRKTKLPGERLLN